MTYFVFTYSYYSDASLLVGAGWEISYIKLNWFIWVTSFSKANETTHTE